MNTAICSSWHWPPFLVKNKLAPLDLKNNLPVRRRRHRGYYDYITILYDLVSVNSVLYHLNLNDLKC